MVFDRLVVFEFHLVLVGWDVVDGLEEVFEEVVCLGRSLVVDDSNFYAFGFDMMDEMGNDCFDLRKTD